MVASFEETIKRLVRQRAQLDDLISTSRNRESVSSELFEKVQHLRARIEALAGKDVLRKDPGERS
jgi:hypothetical protein